MPLPPDKRQHHWHHSMTMANLTETRNYQRINTASAFYLPRRVILVPHPYPHTDCPCLSNTLDRPLRRALACGAPLMQLWPPMRASIGGADGRRETRTQITSTGREKGHCAGCTTDRILSCNHPKAAKWLERSRSAGRPKRLPTGRLATRTPICRTARSTGTWETG